MKRLRLIYREIVWIVDLMPELREMIGLKRFLTSPFAEVF
jgi:hypothetical protein